MANKCHDCGRVSYRHKAVNNKVICGRCYYINYCYLCSPEVLIGECKGHEFTALKENRFMKDEEFVQGMQFEYESQRTEQALRDRLAKDD